MEEKNSIQQFWLNYSFALIKRQTIELDIVLYYTIIDTMFVWWCQGDVILTWCVFSSIDSLVSVCLTPTNNQKNVIKHA